MPDSDNKALLTLLLVVVLAIVLYGVLTWADLHLANSSHAAIQRVTVSGEKSLALR
jgi:hypothetical protein